MSELVLPLVHVCVMLLFLMVLVDCAWKKLLIRGWGCLPCINKIQKRALEKRKILSERKLKLLKRIYGEQKLELKKAASEMVKEKLANGK